MSRADAESAAEVAAAFLEFWEGYGQRHFREEEEVLLPAFAEYGDADNALVARVLTDHVEIRMRANRLRRASGAASDGPDPEALNELGELLATHVRREERELFPLIEEAMPEDAITELGETFTSSEEARSCSETDAST